jgi:dTDP-4-amino-4,6-dideoxygalactose transaminase
MPVHLFGLSADMEPINSLAHEKRLLVIEDAAQAIGATYHGEYAGNLGSFGCFSFFPSKNLGCAGDGGMVTTSSDDMVDRLRLLRVHGSRKKYQHEILGTNSRLDALQAAILRVKLRYLEQWTNGRRANAENYRRLFHHFGLDQTVTLPSESGPSDRHVYNQFSIHCTERDALRDHLRNAGFPTEVYYPSPLHLQPAFSYLGYSEGQFPNSESASRDVMALPIFPELTEQQQSSIVEAIAHFYRS